MFVHEGVPGAALVLAVLGWWLSGTPPGAGSCWAWPVLGFLALYFMAVYAMILGAHFDNGISTGMAAYYSAVGGVPAALAARWLWGGGYAWAAWVLAGIAAGYLGTIVPVVLLVRRRAPEPPPPTPPEPPPPPPPTDRPRGFATHSMLPGLVILVFLALLLYGRFGWRGPAGLVGFLGVLMAWGYVSDWRADRALRQAWARLTAAADAVAAGGDPPPRALWTAWMQAVARRPWPFMEELTRRASDTAHPFREPFQHLIADHRSPAAIAAIRAQVAAHPDDPGAPPRAARLVTVGTTADADAVAAVIAAHPPTALAPVARALLRTLDTVGRRPEQEPWRACAHAHADALAAALPDDAARDRWRGAVGSVSSS